jgi:NADPH2:quinone reductase
MKAAVFDRCGDPSEVLQIRDLPAPEPGRGQVRVRMLASPVNPSDLMFVQGIYGKRPQLPATPGFEGVGIVEAAGAGLLPRLRMGRRVAVLNREGGNWQEQVVVPARQVVPVPAGVPDEQAAAFFVNPASALVMIRSVLKVPRDAWVLQTAAGSALGRMIIRLGHHFGFRTINVVRRREQAQELLEAGGDEVICSAEESIEERTKALTGAQGVPFALDCVGGETCSAVARSLAPGGRLLLYGTLSDEPMVVHPRVLMTGQKRIEGFWMSEWTQAQSIVTMLRLFGQIGRLMNAGILVSEIGQSFPLDQIQSAVKQAGLPARQGKVILRIATA